MEGVGLRKDAALILLLLCASSFSLAYCQSEEEMIQQLIVRAYVEVEEASSLGGDVTILVDELNSIISDLGKDEVELSEYAARLGNVILEAGRLKQSAAEAANTRLLVTVVNFSVAVLAAILVWRYLPRLYWRAWLRLRGGWVVEG